MRGMVNCALALAVLTGACARPYPPPGGEQDNTPPRLVQVSPEPLTVQPGFNAPVVFRFDERLSERGFSETLVVVSPLDGALRVDRGRSEVRVQIDGGWRENRVYRVVLLPGLRDLFGNARAEPLEVVFSTGPPVQPTAIAGIVTDRVSDRAARDAIVRAVRRADTVSYLALADSGGFFSFRHLPLGEYDLHAFMDQNRNRRRDASEPVDSGQVVSLGSPTDTITTLFSVLAPDSTPPRLTSAEAVDSLHVRLTFDDYIDPDSARATQGQVFTLPDSIAFAELIGALHPTAWERERRAAADTAARSAADSLAARAAAVAPPQPATITPNRSVIVRVVHPLAADAGFVVVVTNVLNLHGLRGGGSARFRTRATPPAAPPVRRDTLLLRER